MITYANAETMKRGMKCYWKHGGTYSTAYFQSLSQMPVTPHAVTIKHGGEEFIVRDFEVFREVDKFKDKHSDILEALLTQGNKILVARWLNVPYSRVLNVFKQAKELGVIHAKEAKTI